MKRLLLTAAIILNANLYAQHSLVEIWRTDAVLKFPEAVVFEPGGQFLYLSNVDGNPLQNDGVGSIGKVGLDGTVFCGESDRRGHLFLHIPGPGPFRETLNPTNPVIQRMRPGTPGLIKENP